MAAVLAGEAAPPRARFLALALAAGCLLFPASAAAQLPDVGATAAGVVNTATQAVTQPTAPAQPVVRQATSAVPKAPVPALKAPPPAEQVVERVKEVVTPVHETVTASVERVAAPVRPTVASAPEAIDQTPAATGERTRRSVPMAEHPERQTPAPVFEAAVGPRGKLFAPLAAETRSFGAPADRPEARHGSPTPQPVPSAPEWPPVPSGGASAAPAGLAFAGFVALFGAVALLLAGTARRLHLTPAAMRPAPFISLLERPG